MDVGLPAVGIEGVKIRLVPGEMHVLVPSDPAIEQSWGMPNLREIQGRKGKQNH
jgi:hypothetical protein